tara:strand:- start:2404 stop:4050 length:1647 start_codon:yes stop_codon:yes gene_type:complete
MNNDEICKRISAKYDRLYADQSNWRSIWQECSDYISPRKGNIEEVRSAGQQLTQQLFDTTANEALNTYAAGLVSQLTPAGEVWARYTGSEDAPQDVKNWLDDCSNRAMKIIHASNFYLGWHEDCLDDGTFGSSMMFVDEDDDRVINVVQVPVGTFVWVENHRGQVDQMIRTFEWTAEQIYEKWEENTPKEVMDCLYSSNGDDSKKFKILHEVKPRAKGQWKEGMVSPELRRYSSIYCIREIKGVLETGGYYELPFFAGRQLKSNGEVYGRGSGPEILPEIKVVNRMERDLLTVGELMARPPWISPDDSAYTPDNRPDGVTFYDAMNPNAKPEQLTMKNRPDYGEQKSDQKRQRINRAFFVDMFKMLTNMQEQKREKTAFEVAEMVQEKLLIFSPIFARRVEEKLNPFMERVFGICLRSEKFAQPPQSVIDAGGAMDYEIEYTSRIALAIRASLTNSIGTILQLVGAVASFDPSVMHVVKWRDAVREFLANQGFPANLQRDDAEVDEIMAALQQAAEQQAAAEQAKLMAGAAKDLGPEAQQAATDQVVA